MKRTEDEGLLKDVFGEAAPANFRAAMLGQSLRIVRRRHATRRIGRVGALFVVLGLAVVLIGRHTGQRPDVLSKASPEKLGRTYTLVRSEPLPAAEIVTTSPLSSEEFVAGTAAVRIVQTRSDNFRLINDDELLSLISPRACGLIKTGPNSEQLVFVNPVDAKGFPVF